MINKRSTSWLMPSNRRYLVTAIVMICAGILFPMYPTTTIAQPLVSLLGTVGFNVWCVSMAWAGVGLALYPHRVLMWLIPIYILSFSTIVLAVTFVSLTAFVFYLIIPLSFFWTLYLHRRPQFRYVMLNRDWQWHHWVLILNLTMFAVLLFQPDGAGMDLFYALYHVLFDGRIEPVTFIRLLYLSMIILSWRFNQKPNLIVVRICSIPLMLHGGTFFLVSLIQPDIVWSVVPLLMLPPFLLWDMSGEYYSYE